MITMQNRLIDLYPCLLLGTLLFGLGREKCYMNVYIQYNTVSDWLESTARNVCRPNPPSALVNKLMLCAWL